MKQKAILLLGVFLLSLVPSGSAAHDPNDFFIPDTPTPMLPRYIEGSSTTNVWGIQSSARNAVVNALHRVAANQWEVVPTGLVAVNAGSGISVLSPTAVYVVAGGLCGQPGADIAVYSGTTFATQDIIGLCSADDVWAVSTTDVWVAGGTDSGNLPAVAHWDGATWTITVLANAEPIHRFWAFGSDIWALRDNGVLSHWNGSDFEYVFLLFTTFPIVPTSGGVALWGVSPSTFYTFGFNATTGTNQVHRSTNGGLKWTVLLDLGPVIPRAIHGSSLTNIWLGVTGSLMHSTDGLTFSDTNPTGPFEPGTSDNQGVWAGSSTFVLVGASNAVNNGFVSDIQLLQVNPAVAVPSLIGLQWDPNDLFVTVSHAQCNGDLIGFGVNVEPSLGAGGLASYVINSDTGIVVETFTQASYFSLSSKHFHQNRVYPTGEYTFVVTADVSGLLTPDNYAAMEFSVPMGTCVDSPTDISPIREWLEFEANQTNTYVNGTAANLTENLTAVHVHIDSHFNTTDALIVSRTFYTNSLINTSRIEILDAIGDISTTIECGENATNCEFEPMTMIDLPGFTDQQVGAFLLFLVLLIVSYFQRWLFVAIACVIGILDLFLLGGVFGFEFTGLLLVLGIMLQIFVDIRDAYNERKAEKEAETT